MNRREFIKSVGAAGVFTLLGTIHLYGSKEPVGAALKEGDKNAGQAGHIGLKGPFDVAFDSAENLVVSDPPSYRVVRFDPSNRETGSFGGAGSQVGNFNFPKGLAVDPDGLTYVVDSNNCRVQVFSPDGKVATVLGSVGSIGGSFATPQGVFIDGKGRALVSDTRNHRIQIFQGGAVVAIIGEFGDDMDQFRLPTACVATPDGEIVVLDSKHGQVKVFGADTKFKHSFGGVGKNPGQLNLPQGMALDTSGRVWVADTGNHRIQEFTLDGKLLSVVGKEGSGPQEFKSPTGIAWRKEKMYVADNGNKRIQILSKS